MPPIVEMRGIHKSFGPVKALQGVDLALDRREVLGLVGDNGAGKSTLMKVLTGAYQPDAGQILFDGQPVNFTSPYDSRQAGIEMVYQDLALAGNLSVTGNVFMGREVTRSYLGGLIRLMDEGRMEDATRNLLHRLRIEIPSVRLRVENLSGGQRQAVAVARATAFNARVVIMDEPTASLAVREVGKVLDLIRSLEAHDVSVILISHRLQDIFQVCDRVMVLRQGLKVGDLRIADTTMDEVVGLIVGAREASAEVAA
jgi:simple sugar transport system ATP-binding protein